VSWFVERVGLGHMNWSQAMREASLNADFWVMREREEREAFPWEIIDFGIQRSFLWEEYQRAMNERQTPSCQPKSGCRSCGVCDTE
jgi:hypothetical protein